jgi:hypothetical protein
MTAIVMFTSKLFGDAAGATKPKTFAEVAAQLGITPQFPSSFAAAAGPGSGFAAAPVAPAAPVVPQSQYINPFAKAVAALGTTPQFPPSFGGSVGPGFGLAAAPAAPNPEYVNPFAAAVAALGPLPPFAPNPGPPLSSIDIPSFSNLAAPGPRQQGVFGELPATQQPYQQAFSQGALGPLPAQDQQYYAATQYQPIISAPANFSYFAPPPTTNPFERDAAERKEAQRKASEEEERRRKEEEAKWRAMAFMPRKERAPAAQPVPAPLFEEPARRFIYDPQPAYVATPRNNEDAAALILARMCRESEERSARLSNAARKRTFGDLEEEEWRTRGDYPECREYEEREAKRRRKSRTGVWWRMARWAAGVWAVGRLFGVF